MLLQLAEKSTDQFDNRRTEHLFQLECNNIYLYIYTVRESGAEHRISQLQAAKIEAVDPFCHPN